MEHVPPRHLVARSEDRVTPDGRASFLSTVLGIKVDPVSNADTAVIAVCSAVFGITTIILIYGWFNIKFRPIRAKNMLLITLLHMCGILWFLGNIPANGHVRLYGVFGHCKFWIIWMRILFCFFFAYVLILRFYALDRVFNQKKPFRLRTTLISLGIIVVGNIVFCLISQFVSSDLTVTYNKPLEVCDVTQHYRIAAITLQWVSWASVAILIYRLRNIQSSFNELLESIIIFLIAIFILIETTVTNVAFKYYPLLLKHRIEKTLVDMLAANVIVLLIIAQPIYMCLFHRRDYERQWLEKLTRDGSKGMYDVSSNAGNNGTNGSTAYARMDDDSAIQHTQLNFGSMDAGSSIYLGADPEDTLRANPVVLENGDNLPMAMRANLRIHRPTLNSPNMFTGGTRDSPVSGGRRVL